MTLFNYNLETKMTEQIEAFKLNLKMCTNKPKVNNIEAALHRIEALESSQADLLRLHSTTYDLLQDLVRVVSTDSRYPTSLPHREPLHLKSEAHTKLPSQPRQGSLPAKSPPLRHSSSQPAKSLPLRQEDSCVKLPSPEIKVNIKEENCGVAASKREEQKLHIQHLTSFID